MLLEVLYKTIEELRGRAQEHEQILRQNETRTRYALVDPLLTALGWNLSDPAQTVPEFSLKNAKRADYGLLGVPGAPPAVFIEAKSLGTSLESGLSQSIGYCLEDGVQYFGVTDGARWEIYDTHRPVPLPHKKVLEFNLRDGTHSVVLKALWLWRDNHAAGGTPVTPQAPEQPASGTGSEPARTEPMPPVTGDLPTLTGQQMAHLDDGTVALCPSKPDGIEFLKKHNAWGFIRLNRAPKYLALYISQPVSAIQFVGEVERVIDGDDPSSPVGTETEAYQPNRKLVVLKRGRLWRLAEQITLGVPRPGKAPQGPRYLELSELAIARTLDDLLD